MYLPLCVAVLCLLLTTIHCQEISEFNDGDTSVDVTSRKPSFIFRRFKSISIKSNSDNNVENIDKDDPVPRNYYIPAGLEFTCKNRAPGYYSDPSPQSRCQVYHLCMPDGRKFTQLCGVATVFNQRTFVCDHWYNYNCSEAESDYKLNDELWQDVSPANSNRVELDSDESKEI